MTVEAVEHSDAVHEAPWHPTSSMLSSLLFLRKAGSST